MISRWLRLLLLLTTIVVMTALWSQVHLRKKSMMVDSSLGRMLMSEPGSSGSHPRDDEEAGEVLMSIFTTFKGGASRRIIETNTLKNWALFLPVVEPVLFSASTSGPVEGLAAQLGWQVLPITNTNHYGTPKLISMYTHLMNITHHNSVFYGFCNGDILFDGGLLTTLRLVQHNLSHLNSSLVIGRRTNVAISSLKHPELLHHWSNVSNSRGTLFADYAIDYFFIANADRFIWDKLKDVVIGRPAYDNYLVAMAIYHNVSVIDASRTIKAVHQTGRDGDRAGHRYKDSDYNSKLIGVMDVNKGLTSVAPYVTLPHPTQEIILKRRRTR